MLYIEVCAQIIQNNLMVLKELYRLMDPSVKKSGDAQGEVQLSFKYNDEQSAVLVKVINILIR